MQNLSCGNEFSLHDNKKIIFTRKVLHLASFKNRGLRHLGNGRLTLEAKRILWDRLPWILHIRHVQPVGGDSGEIPFFQVIHPLCGLLR